MNDVFIKCKITFRKQKYKRQSIVNLINSLLNAVKQEKFYHFLPAISQLTFVRGKHMNQVKVINSKLSGIEAV